ncbi:MAG: hypothetical protein KatS3mg115_0986 [Candidatus Poribacteria bacterium]|nr:MAG: hypothetical protein KatS3mg115_0986 [Candidatus Poribacteria bacterium]
MNPTEDVRQRWSQTPLAWGRERIADTPRLVRRNWATMSRRLAELLRSALKGVEGVRLLDVGCGNGGFLDLIEDLVAEYYGLDPSFEMLQAGRKLKRGGYVLGLGEALPFRDGVFDVVVLKSVLMHCIDPEQVLGESARVLQGGGLCLISVANDAAWYRPLMKLADRMRHRRGAVGRTDAHLHRLDTSRLQALSARAGLIVLHWESLGFGVLPSFVERPLSDRWIERIGAWADRAGGALWPQRGGSLILLAQKGGSRSRSSARRSPSVPPAGRSAPLTF